MASELQEPSFNLLAVTSDGTILCLERETLAEKWRAASSSYLTGPSGAAHLGCAVESAQSALATEVIEGFFHGKPDLLGGLYQQKITRDSFDPDVLVLIVSLAGQSTSEVQRELLVLAIHDSSAVRIHGSTSQARIIQISAATLPTPSEAPTAPDGYRLHVESGGLQELRGTQIYTYRIEDGVPKLSYTLPVPNASSFLRLSDSSTLTATPTSLSIYNPAYRSVQATTALDISTGASSAPKTDDSAAPYQLITYFPRLEIALGIRGSTLFAAQLEAPKTRKRKRRAEGLLIDCIGRGLSHATDAHKWTVPDQTPDIFASYVPGSLSEEYWRTWAEDTAKADELLGKKDLVGFEQLVADKLGAQLTLAKAPNGVSSDVVADDGNAMELDTADEQPLLEVEDMPQVDRRWVLFAITRVFALNNQQGDGMGKPVLTCQLVGSNVADYLISTGYMSVSNVKSAFSSEAREIHDVETVLAEEIPQLISKLDPTLELLAEYLVSTKLGATELLASIRLIMRSLDLVQDPTKLTQKLIGFGETENAGEANEEALDKLEEDLEVTEYHLLDDSSTRARGLTVAFNLLGSCSSMSTVQAIRRLFRPEETLSLIHVLRVELVKGGWTARYLDTSLPEGEDEQEPPPDGSIRLIADLLCRCIDSVGAGGWMINDALLARTGDHLDSADFLAGLRLEVSAALEGIQEAVYLRGLLTETVKYGNNVQRALVDVQSHKTPQKGTHKGVPYKGTPQSRMSRNKPQNFSASAAESQILPLGLASKQRVSATKIVGGGEIVTRSKREIGHLVSQRVGAYSLERIVV
jgi:hypothetical protein